MIENERKTTLNKYPIKGGKYVLYWMQASQRTELNHALEYSIKQANITTKSLVVIFCVEPNFPETNARHYFFMLEGLAEIRKTLKKRHIKMVIKTGKFVKTITETAKNAGEIIVDAGCLKFQRKCRLEIAKKSTAK